jgi:hypothetical protein
MTERNSIAPDGDRVEYWSWGPDVNDPTIYVEMVYVQDGAVRVSYNMFSMLLREAGYRKVDNPCGKS